MQSKPRQTLDEGKTYLALGDSYTTGEAIDPVNSFPVQVVSMLRAANLFFKDPEVIAGTGWTTDDLLSALSDHASLNAYDLVTLLIGVNNQYQGGSRSEYKKQFTELLQQSMRLAGNRPSHVIVLSIPDYSVTPFASGSDGAAIASQIGAFNMINKDLADNYQVQYIDITGESRKAAHDRSLVAADGLHFSGKAYSVWASMLVRVIETMATDTSR